jgi:hypothetical protein
VRSQKASLFLLTSAIFDQCRLIRNFQLHRGFGFQPNVFYASKKEGVGHWEHAVQKAPLKSKTPTIRLEAKPTVKLGNFSANPLYFAKRRTPNVER